MENTIETKNCKHCGTSFEITDRDMEFYTKVSPIIAGTKFQIPTPTFCPDCRQQRRLNRQNMTKLYKRKCDATGASVISNFSPDKTYKVYDQKYWWSDQWNFKNYGKDYDPQKSFFEQFNELLLYVPVPSLFTEFLNDVNSAYTNFAGYNKNCYLIFHADMNEDCIYATGLKNSKKCIDSLNVFNCELAYECTDCQDCYGTMYSQDCENCSNSRFIKNCIGCKNCFGSINIQNGEYLIFNKQVSKEEYATFINEFNTGGMQALLTNKNKFMEMTKHAIYKPTAGHQNQDCAGDHLFKCRDVTKSRDVKESRDMKFCERIYNGPNSDCYDVDQFGMHIERVYNTSVIGQDSQNVIACATSYNLQDVYYSIYAFNSKNCFGCVGIGKAEYCILNKQYTKAEYEELAPKIIEHMQKTGERGEFFPSSISPFGYNETVAQEYFPLTKEQSLNQGFKRSDYEAPFPKTDAKDVIICEVSGKPFRLIPQEIEFYKKHNLPSPTKHPDIRHAERMALRNPRKLRDRKCMKCGTDIKTTYAPERPEIVYCEECYNKEIY